MLKVITLTCTVTREDFSFKQIYHYLSQIELNYVQHLEAEPVLTIETRDLLSGKVLDVLDIVGEMSQPIFNQRSEIENRWTMTCKDADAARDGWIREYTNLHKPYDRLKNRAYNLFCKINDIPEEES